MFDDNYYLIDELKRKVYENFPSANINVVRSEDGEYFFSVDNRELYYSDDFQLFLMKLKIGAVWGRGIYNIFFTLDERVNKINSIIFSNSISNAGMPDWKTDNTPAIAVDSSMSWKYQLMAA